MAEFEVATGAAELPAGDDRGREAAVRTAFEGLLQIRRLMNADTGDAEGARPPGRAPAAGRTASAGRRPTARR
ncbi:hypothetical protein ACWEWX_38015, partial [Streptomyces asiaticus]